MAKHLGYPALDLKKTVIILTPIWNPDVVPRVLRKHLMLDKVAGPPPSLQ